MLKKRILQLAVILVALLVTWEGVMLFRVSRLAAANPRTTAFMEQRKDELRAANKSDELNYTFVPLEKISPNLRSAVLVSEDSKFFEHGGVDTEVLEKLLKEAWAKKELGRGGSTITQQLAKNLYLSPSRNPLRKVRELTITKYLEWMLSKRRILELYLNVVEMGERVYGAEAASRHYFGVPASNLSPAQAALLAGALPNPRKMNPGNPGPYLRSRRDIIVSRMQRWGYEMDQRITNKAVPEESDAERITEPGLIEEERLQLEDSQKPDEPESNSPADKQMEELNLDENSIQDLIDEPNEPDRTSIEKRERVKSYRP